ncbi:DNA-binding response regulator [Larkinella rosea]|uniref:DNA-binding response regulator n=2 Tax=Larkinella rosea TaxID=2025312 RepID=A0A3P1BEX8_9BACT|nr:DNA-binding response regulator [Larkinella rosea]
MDEGQLDKPLKPTTFRRKDFSILVAQAELFNCEVISQLLKQQGYNVVGMAIEIKDTLQQILTKHPHCVILDSEISGRGSVDIFEKARTDNPGTKFILYTSKPDLKIVAYAMQRGFYGFLYATDGLDELYKCFQIISGGGYYYSPGFLLLLKNYGMNLMTEETKLMLNRLTSRELEVLRLITQEIPGHEIVDQLSISDKDLENYKINIAQKLGLGSTRNLEMLGQFEYQVKSTITGQYAKVNLHTGSIQVKDDDRPYEGIVEREPISTSVPISDTSFDQEEAVKAENAVLNYMNKHPRK